MDAIVYKIVTVSTRCQLQHVSILQRKWETLGNIFCDTLYKNVSFFVFALDIFLVLWDLNVFFRR